MPANQLLLAVFQSYRQASRLVRADRTRPNILCAVADAVRCLPPVPEPSLADFTAIYLGRHDSLHLLQPIPASCLHRFLTNPDDDEQDRIRATVGDKVDRQVGKLS